MRYAMFAKRGGVLAAVLFSLVSAPLRAQDEALSKEAVRLNDVVGEDAISGQIRQLGGRPEHAKKLVTAAAALATQKDQPLNYNAAYILGMVARQLQDVESGKRLFRLCITKADELKSDRKRVLPYAAMLAMLFENQEQDEAVKTAKDFLELNDYSVEQENVGEDEAGVLGQTEAFKKNPADAKKLLAALVAHGKSKQPRALNYAAAYFLGCIGRQAKDVDAGEFFFRICLMKAERLKNEHRLAMAYLQLIDLFFESRQFDRTEKVCREFLEVSGDRELRGFQVVAMLRLVEATALQGKTAEALKMVEPFLKAAPDDLEVVQIHSWLLRQAGKYDEAAQAYERLLGKLANEELKDQVRYRLSGIYSEAGAIDKAADHLKALLKKKPDDASYNNDLGYIWADHDQNLDEAEQMIRKAVDKEPQNPSYLDSLGWVLFKRKKYEDAKKYLLEAVKHPDGQHAEIYEHLGDVYQALSDKAEAVNFWKKAVDAAGSSKREVDRKVKLEKKLKENQ